MATATRPDVLADVYSTPVNVGNVSSRVLQSLRDAGITGNYQVADLYRQGHGKQVIVIIVVNQPIVSKVALHEPNGANVIYVQQSDGWKKIPSQVPTLDRSVSLEPPLGEDAIALLRINEAGGFGTGFEVWKATN